MLPESSCKDCEKLINTQIESPILSGEWGYLRSRVLFSTRKKKRRKQHIKLGRKGGGTFKMPVADYSGPVPIYQFGQARIFSGLPRGCDSPWHMEILTSEKVEEEAKKKHPQWDGRHHIKARPVAFARMLAKIAYSYAIAEIGLGGFDPIVTGIILGKSDDIYYFVGGSFDFLPPRDRGGHALNIRMDHRQGKAIVVVDIRIFSQLEWPDYHVAVGIIDFQNFEHVRLFEQHRLQGKIKIIPFNIG